MGIYLDHHAAAPVHPEVYAAMEHARSLAFANPSSQHGPGRACASLLEGARSQVAAAIGARPSEVVFTSGGTEACNAALRGVAVRYTSDVEHAAVQACAADAERLSVQQLAGIAALPELLPGDWVAVQWVNHETGTVWDVERLAAWCKRHDAHLFVDATQALGKMPVDVVALGADALAFAAHKCGGPSGAGALWLRAGVLPPSLLLGGSQERGRRAGSPAVEACVGFGAACARVEARIESMAQVGRWRAMLEDALIAAGCTPNGTELDGRALPRVPTCINASAPGWTGAVLCAALDMEGVHASAGPACSSGTPEPSRTVAALHGAERAKGAFRLSLGPLGLSDSRVEEAAGVLARVLARASS